MRVSFEGSYDDAPNHRGIVRCFPSNVHAQPADTVKEDDSIGWGYAWLRCLND